MKRDLFDREAEQAALGAVMIENEALELLKNLVEPSDFYYSDHRHIYSAMLEISEGKMAIDEYTSGTALRKKGLLDQAGGFAYLSELALLRFDPDHIAGYARIIKSHSEDRKIVQYASGLVEKMTQTGKSSVEINRTSQDLQLALTTRLSSGRKSLFEPIDETAVFVFNQLSEVSKGLDQDPDFVPGIRSGFQSLDKLTLGFMPGEYVCIGGRPGMAKSALASHLAQGFAEDFQKKGEEAVVLWASLEMLAKENVSRVLAQKGKIKLSRIKTGAMEAEDWDKIAFAHDNLGTGRIKIADQSGISIEELIAAVTLEHKRQPVKALIIDYLQLLRLSSAKNNQTTNDIVNEISRKIKAMAQNLGIVVVVLSQLSRALEKRTDKRPIPSDLRDSGGIEQDADIILFLYRDEVYREHSPDQGTCELIVAKHRSGATGRIKLGFRADETRFFELGQP